MVSAQPDWPPKLAGQRQAEIDAQLADLRARFPGWEITGIFAGWRAVPAGSPVLESIDLDGLAEKLERQGEVS